MQYTGQNSSDHIIAQYEVLKRLQPHWEKGYFYLGKYYDALLTYVRKDGLNLNLTWHIPSASSQHLDSGQDQGARSGTTMQLKQAQSYHSYLPVILSNYGVRFCLSSFPVLFQILSNQYTDFFFFT